MSFLAKQDPNIKAVIDQELMRQRDKLEMIASENIVSQAVIIFYRIQRKDEE